jgi:hypothetical protein
MILPLARHAPTVEAALRNISYVKMRLPCRGASVLLFAMALRARGLLVLVHRAVHMSAHNPC